MKDKYAIISLNLYEKDNNWGSVLQSYALQKILFSLGIDNEILDYKPDFIKKNYARYPYKIYSLKSLLKPKNLWRFLNIWLIRKDFVERDDKFQKWMRENYIISSNHYTSKNAMLLDYKGYIVGSDIVWHIPFWNGFDDGYFCNYSSMKNSHNISYAPSMGDKKLTEDEIRIFTEMLKNFNNISIREKSNYETIKKCTTKDVSVVLDPTLLLSYKDYECITKKERVVQEKYLLLYVVSLDKNLLNYVNEINKKYKLKIVFLSCCPVSKKYLKEYIIMNNAGIDEWLSLIRDAEMIFTNSFHCCIFSIIFKKKFFSTLRGEFGSGKIIDLLSMLNLQSRYSNSANINFNLEDEINYDNVFKEIEINKENSINYLKDALL